MEPKRGFSEEKLQLVAESVDQLISLDITGWGPGRGRTSILYPPVRERHGGKPLCMSAAKELARRVGHGDFVLIPCGMLVYPLNLPETDGPVGGAALARALQIGLGAKPVLVTDSSAIDVTRAACRGAALNIVDIQSLMKTERTVSVIGFPIDDDEAKTETDRIFEDLSPKAIVAIERRGRNEKGVYHGFPGGINMNEIEGKTVYLFDKAREKGVLTIGIGDGGNEIGWASVADVIKEKIPFGDKCSCGCGGGVGDATVVDVPIAACISNWGAYGVISCLSALLDKPEVLHDTRVESRMLRECIDAGGIDGVSCRPEPKVDGLPEEIDLAILSLLREIVNPDFA